MLNHQAPGRSVSVARNTRLLANTNSVDTSNKVNTMLQIHGYAQSPSARQICVCRKKHTAACYQCGYFKQGGNSPVYYTSITLLDLDTFNQGVNNSLFYKDRTLFKGYSIPRDCYADVSSSLLYMYSDASLMK
jgi:hypothetical protein